MRFRTHLLTLSALAFSAVVAACANDTITSAMAPTDGPAMAATFNVSCNQALPAGMTVTGGSATPNTLWPPNHKMWNVEFSYTVTGNCITTPVCSGLSVTSNEPINGLGDGNTAPDWIITGPTSVQLRSERSGLGSGRIYTLGVTCTATTTPLDPLTGLITTGVPVSGSTSANVTVVHDQGKKG